MGYAGASCVKSCEGFKYSFFDVDTNITYCSDICEAIGEVIFDEYNWYVVDGECWTYD